jgi:hypothetical protein
MQRIKAMNSGLNSWFSALLSTHSRATTRLSSHLACTFPLPGLLPRRLDIFPLAQTCPKHGPDMDQTWPKHGPNMAQTWPKHGPHMVHTWSKQGPNMPQTWLEHGPTMAQLWLTHEMHSGGLTFMCWWPLFTKLLGPDEWDAAIYVDGYIPWGSHKVALVVLIVIEVPEVVVLVVLVIQYYVSSTSTTRRNTHPIQQ